MLLITSATSVISWKVSVSLRVLFLGKGLSLGQKVGDVWFLVLVFLTSMISKGIEVSLS